MADENEMEEPAGSGRNPCERSIDIDFRGTSCRRRPGFAANSGGFGGEVPFRASAFLAPPEVGDDGTEPRLGSLHRRLSGQEPSDRLLSQILSLDRTGAEPICRVHALPAQHDPVWPSAAAVLEPG